VFQRLGALSASAPATRRRRPRQRRSIETVEAILEAAAQVFERHGYAAGTTNRIAARAGISVGSLYQYFADKDDILVALVERHLDEGAAMLEPVMRGLLEEPPPVHVALGLLADSLLELHRHRPNLHRVLFEEAPRPPSLRARLDATFDAAADSLAAYLALRPELAICDRRLAAELVVQALEAITHGLVIHPRSEVPAEEYAREAVTLCERYLAG